MLERPPGGTTIRRPAGLMGMSSGVGGPGQGQEERKISRLHEKRTHEAAWVEKNSSQFKEQRELQQHIKDCCLYSCCSEEKQTRGKSDKNKNPSRAFALLIYQHFKLNISSKHSNNCCHILALFKTQEVFQDTLLLPTMCRMCHRADSEHKF